MFLFLFPQTSPSPSFTAAICETVTGPSFPVPGGRDGASLALPWGGRGKAPVLEKVSLREAHHGHLPSESSNTGSGFRKTRFKYHL